MTTTKTKKRARPFVKAYIESGFNASEAARKVLKVNPSEARQRGYRMLTNDYVQKTLADVLSERDGLNDDVLKSLLKRNAKQNKNLPASNTAIDMVIKVKGGYSPEKHANYNLNLTDKQLDDRLKELENDLRLLREGVE